MSSKAGIFCLEGNWSKDLRKSSSVEPGLEMLFRGAGVPFIHRRIATQGELDYYLKKWCLRRYEGYPILYLASHGKDGCISIDTGVVTLEVLGEMLNGKCEHQIIYFGSCKTLVVDKRKIKSFIKKTKALAVCGFGTDIDWLPATAFDLMVFEILQEPNSFDLVGMRNIEEKIKTRLGSIHKNLKFRMVLRDPSSG